MASAHSLRTIFLLVLACVFVQYVNCHLKDLGEVVIKRNVINHSYSLSPVMIKGGIEANQFPFNVIFVNFGGMCGGTILAKKVVLTAGHCFDYNRNISEMKILSNARTIYDFKSNIHNVWDYTVHENYNKAQTFANDIAIILIHDNFIFNIHVQRAFIVNTDIWMNETETFTVTGWGSHKFGEHSRLKWKPSKLMKAEMRYVKNKFCETRNSVSLSPEMFCLYGDRKRDTCQGDSGGNVLWKDLVVGIISHGQGCGAEPSMYTNVYYMKTWITQATQKLYDKFCQHHGIKQDNISSLGDETK